MRGSGAVPIESQPMVSQYLPIESVFELFRWLTSVSAHPPAHPPVRPVRYDSTVLEASLRRTAKTRLDPNGFLTGSEGRPLRGHGREVDEWTQSQTTMMTSKGGRQNENKLLHTASRTNM